MPDAWHGLFKILQPHQTASQALKAPLILGGWDVPSEMKQDRFKGHLEFAVSMGISEQVAIYLLNLKPTQWFRG